MRHDLVTTLKDIPQELGNKSLLTSKIDMNPLKLFLRNAIRRILNRKPKNYVGPHPPLFGHEGFFIQ